MKKENIGAYGFDRSKEGYAEKALEKSKQNIGEAISEAARALGRRGGQSTSEAKQRAARENGKKGGRPRKKRKRRMAGE